MKPQTSQSTDIPVTQEVTPVIVKIGGGDSAPAVATGTKTYNVNIACDLMKFQDESGESWNQASSNLPGRIHELGVQEGNLNPLYCNVSPQSDALTTVEVTFETKNGPAEKLIIKEQKNGHDFLLDAQSSVVPFSVTQPAPHGGWKASNATFTSKPLMVTLTQTNAAGEDLVVFEYLFNHGEISLNIDFHFKE